MPIGDDVVANFLEGKCEDTCEEITFAQWITTDRTEMINQTLPFNEYLKLLMTKLIKLLSHSFIAKQQSIFFFNHKQFSENETVIYLLDFSKNYTFHVQGEG